EALPHSSLRQRSSRAFERASDCSGYEQRRAVPDGEQHLREIGTGPEGAAGGGPCQPVL
ncbi:MAG: hypothetical protein AVDCRST_MAG91-348, partial [uncultured Sphingomonadaceae bacterium]